MLTYPDSPRWGCHSHPGKEENTIRKMMLIQYLPYVAYNANLLGKKYIAFFFFFISMQDTVLRLAT